ncbi:MAG: universal stress protein [Cyclobacteriaceae bacterium]|nr:universal stress protein [Cyclobacteriaceae bacterium]
MRVLIPTDFSTTANNALEYASNISNLAKSSITLLHIYTPVVSPNNMLSALVTDEILAIKKEALLKLGDLQKMLEVEFPGIVCKTEVAVGEVVKEILAKAKADDSEIIVMGTMGASNLSRALFGSNTALVIEKSDCPVLCIPSGYTFKAPKRILFATNFSYHDIHGISKLITLAKTFDSEIVVAHVDTTPEDDAELSSLEKFVAEVKLTTGYKKITQMMVSDHNVGMGLESIIDTSNIDLLALATHRRNFFEKFYKPSLTKKISLYTQIPIAVFQNPTDEIEDGTDF